MALGRARDGRRGGGVVRRGRGGSAATSTSTSTRAVSSALVSFETPACAIGSGTLALAVGRGGGADVVVDATLATTFLRRQRVAAARTTSKDWSLESFETSVARVGGVRDGDSSGWRDDDSRRRRVQRFGRRVVSFRNRGPRVGACGVGDGDVAATPRLAAGRRAK